MIQESFIRNVKKITDKQRRYLPNSDAINTQSLANYMPNGAALYAKNIEGSNTRKTLESLAANFRRMEQKFQELADQYYMFTTTKFIIEWETALGIPDNCFSNDPDIVDLEQRRKQIVARFALSNITTKDDFIALADFFGVNITITTGIEQDTFPMTFPFILGGDPDELLYIVIVTFVDIAPPDAFPYTFPITFGETELPYLIKMIECLFNSLKPANVNFIYRFGG